MCCGRVGKGVEGVATSGSLTTAAQQLAPFEDTSAATQRSSPILVRFGISLPTLDQDVFSNSGEV